MRCYVAWPTSDCRLFNELSVSVNVILVGGEIRRFQSVSRKENLRFNEAARAPASGFNNDDLATASPVATM